MSASRARYQFLQAVHASNDDYQRHLAEGLAELADALDESAPRERSVDDVDESDPGADAGSAADFMPFAQIRAIAFDKRLTISHDLRDRVARAIEDVPDANNATVRQVLEGNQSMINALLIALIELEAKVEGVELPEG